MMNLRAERDLIRQLTPDGSLPTEAQPQRPAILDMTPAQLVAESGNEEAAYLLARST